MTLDSYKAFQWWHSTDEDQYQGPCLTREEAIAEGDESREDDQWLYICEANKETPSLPDGERFCEMFLDQNEDRGGEDPFGEDFNPTSEQHDELTAELRKVFCAWLDKHKLWPAVWNFNVVRNKESIPPREDPDAVRDEMEELRRQGQQDLL